LLIAVNLQVTLLIFMAVMRACIAFYYVTSLTNLAGADSHHLMRFEKRQVSKVTLTANETSEEGIILSGEDFEVNEEEAEKSFGSGSSITKLPRPSCLWSRRRQSTYKKNSCNSGVTMGGSECFVSCDWPNMSSKWFSWSGGCKCSPGFQQGPEDGNGSEGICIPCGCMNIAKKDGYSLDLCPQRYPDGWWSKGMNVVDGTILPKFAEVKKKGDGD
jgi:hypothetical protein